ncbi:MAG: beta strand repeat-containing protein [Acidimicrobiales bacterium]
MLHTSNQGLKERFMGHEGQHRRRSSVARRTLQGALGLAIAVVPFVVTIPDAFAGVGFGVVPTFPSVVTVGQTGLPANLTIQNTSTTPDNASNVTLSTIDLVPACGTTFGTAPINDCPIANADPGVFTLSPTGTGQAGTACAGTTFTITTVDPATGQVSFSPSTPVVLQPPGTGPGGALAECVIDFTFTVNMGPTHVDANGQVDQLGFASGTNTLGHTGSGAGSSAVTVNLATLGITTSATSTATVGGGITDTATVSAAAPPGPAPTGTITFTAFTNSTCSGAPAFTSNAITVTGTGNYTSTPPFVTTAPGSVFWIASYSGDVSNAPVATHCGDAGETTTVNQAVPTIVTAASTTATIGGPISDSAVLANGLNPTGTITFTAFGPGNATCTAPAAFTSAPLAVAGNGTYMSGPFTPTTPGTYLWVASYSGDTNNAAVATPCGDMGETSTVNKATPAIVTTASGSGPVGSVISDSAVLSGGVDTPTGTITFNVFGPDNASCTGAPVFTSTATVNGNGTYSSSMFTTTAAGTYLFVASYSGDANNNAVASACGAANESVTITKASPAIATTPSPSVTAGGLVSDSATLSSGVNPTGTITFTLFGPGNPTCTGAAIFTSTASVNAGNGVYNSAAFTTTTPGTYNWVASYSGDANNNAVASTCASETVVVTQAHPTIMTQASASVPVGGTITDTATLAGGVSPTGTITFSIFAPGNPTCAGAPVATSMVPVTGNGNYVSAPFTTTAVGTYMFVVIYSGDTANASATSACGAANEAVTTTQATPTIATTPSVSVPVGGAVSDSATLANGLSPTGSITFTLFGPGNPTCTGAQVFTSNPIPVTGNGTYTSNTFTATMAGSYNWIATYSGDANNHSVASTCASETVVVTTTTPKIVTNASLTVPVGGTISDTATLSNGVNPTGTITFDVFGPNDATCSTVPAFTSVVSVTSGNGTYSSGPFTAVMAGTYRFVAMYSGDANNAAVTTMCNDPNESVVVTTVTPSLSTTASASVAVSGTVSDTAILSGGSNPTGTITFELFGPVAGCTGAPIFTATKPVTGDGAYSSGTFTPTAPGTYNFEASYSGDANNNAIPLTACGAAGENVTVTPATPAIVTMASASVAAGGTISDTATLTGGDAPTGTITFTVYGPGNTTCAGTGVASHTVAVTGDGSYASGSFPAAIAGTYRFIAAYSGDANNSAESTGCNDANESVVVTPAAPTLVTHASSTVAAGGTIQDTATLSGGASPMGTITITLFGPNNAACTGTPIQSTTDPVNGDGDYTSTPFVVNAAGTYQYVAVYGGDANNAGATSACGAANESVVVTPAAPTIATQASAPVAVGNPITDVATLSGGDNPTGTITFNVFGPHNATCTGAPVFSSTMAVTGDGNYTSNPFTPTMAGTYRFVDSYSGDANNAPTASACGAANESVAVGVASPTIVTTASAPVVAGGNISDIAVLSGGVTPSGTITFDVFGPNNATCTGAPLFTSTVPVAGNGSYASAPFTTTLAGTYQFVASYSGDANNGAVTSACDAANESVVVAKAGPAIATQASAPVTVGGAISDSATLSGGTGPSGTITFQVFGPNNATCTGAAAFTSSVTVAGNGTYASMSFTPTQPGTYRFVATYGGDANNAAAGPTSCGDPAESTVVSPGATTIVTKVSGSTTVGGTITDTATLAGGVNPTGTITFQVFGPNNATCTGIPAFTSTVPVTGNGNYTSATFTVPGAGTYGFVATYSGDTANSPAGPTACSDPNETTTATKVSPTISTMASPTGTVGGAITDTATLTGGFNPTGTITFQVFGPNNTTCTGAPAATSTAPVSGSGNYTSAPFSPTAPGSYQFVATYGGDANNNAAGPTACNDPAETATVTPSAVTFSTTASPSADVGQPIFDTADLTGSGTPTGTITYNLFGPNNATCTGAPAFTTTVNVNGSGMYTSASFTPTAAGTYEWVDTYSGDATTAPAGPTPCNDAAESVVVLPTPQIAVTKAANPTSEPEPGGNFTFTVTVSNPSTVDPVMITSLVDNIYGNLATLPGSTCGTLIGITLPPGATTPPCTFTGAFNGRAPASQTDTVTVTGVDSHGITVTATAMATVTLTPVLPTISVTKAANPPSLPAPGGTFTFTVQVHNPNTVDPITITSLVDNIYGDLSTRAGSTCGALIGVTLAPGATSSPCTFTGPFTGVSGATQTDTVTVTGMDSNGNKATATANATVALTPGLMPVISVSKAANPLTLPAPGGTFTFTVQVTNPSTTDPITITSLVDNIYGDLSTRAGSTCGALIGVTLAPGATSSPCTFTGPFTGVSGASQTDTVTVTGMDSNGNTATATAMATVSLTPAITPEISVTKAASPATLPAPGGTFTFTVQVHNPSTVDPVTITSLVDNIYGDLSTITGSTCGALIGVTLAPGGTSAPCTFPGSFTGNSGASQTDTVTVTGKDSNGNTVTATANATVSLTPGPTPQISVSKTADPLSKPAPGGTFTFTVEVTNPSTTDPITITSLVDNIYGDLTKISGSTCGALIGVTLAPGASSAPCTFPGSFTGKSGDSQTDTVTATGKDTNGTTVTATAMATVTLTPPAPTTTTSTSTTSTTSTTATSAPPATPVIAVTKAANPISLSAPGGTFIFTVVVSNPSTTVPVKITSLVDNIYGDLTKISGSTCGTLIGVTLSPGQSSSPCSFPGSFTGSGGDTQTDTVTVTGVNPANPSGTPVTATAKATVSIIAATSTPLALTGLDDRRPLTIGFGLIAAGLLVLALCWRRRLN